jgi:DNA-binding XRE family transcriptional regulator
MSKRHVIGRGIRSMLRAYLDTHRTRHPLEIELDRCALTQEQAAKRLRVTPSALSHIINCRRRPSMRLALKMCDVFGIAPDRQRAFLDAVIAVERVPPATPEGERSHVG